MANGQPSVDSDGSSASSAVRHARLAQGGDWVLETAPGSHSVPRRLRLRGQSPIGSPATFRSRMCVPDSVVARSAPRRRHRPPRAERNESMLDPEDARLAQRRLTCPDRSLTRSARASQLGQAVPGEPFPPGPTRHRGQLQVHRDAGGELAGGWPTDGSRAHSAARRMGARGFWCLRDNRTQAGRALPFFYKSRRLRSDERSRLPASARAVLDQWVSRANLIRGQRDSVPPRPVADID